MHLSSFLLLVHLVSSTPLPLLSCFGLCSKTPQLAEEAANGLGRAGGLASFPTHKAPMLTTTRPDLSRKAMSIEAITAKSLQEKPSTDLMTLTKPDLKRPGMDLEKIALGRTAALQQA